MNKDDFINRLRDNRVYKLALRSVDEEQSKKISALVEGWLGSMADSLVPIIDRAQSDSLFKEQLRVAMNGDDPVVIDEEKITSGSKDN